MVITGGSDGMGRAVATNLAGRGAHVVVVARTVSKLQSTVEDMRVSTLSLRLKAILKYILTLSLARGYE